MTKIEESAVIRAFLENAEKTVNFLMRKYGMKISSPIRIFKDKIILFIAERNRGFGGYIPEYTIFILKPESVTFHSLSDALVVSISGIEAKDENEDVFQRVNVETPKAIESDSVELLFYATRKVAEFFGAKSEQVDIMWAPLGLWTELRAVPEISYRLEVMK